MFRLITIDEEQYGQLPHCSEIGIMEIPIDKAQKNYKTVHFGLSHQQKQGTIKPIATDFSEDFHNFVLKQQPDMLRRYAHSRLFIRRTAGFQLERMVQENPHLNETTDTLPSLKTNYCYRAESLNLQGSKERIKVLFGTFSWRKKYEFEHAALNVDYARVYQKEVCL